ncbi:DUF1851 domain-containing protein [Clostridium estertheticum]|nr:DUF1851 domain-containing protein [Clostridium estertheticum]WLC72244.1 DUF1851 domain-containing protein [Clostridium estertheticum]
MEMKDFVVKEQVNINIIEKYKGKVPNQVVEVWGKYGFGSIKNGYLRIVNPDRYMEILEETYVRHELAIPLFTTAMGDIIVWEDGYLMILNFRKNEVNVVGGDCKLFFKNLNDEYYLKKALDWIPYPEAIKKYGEPSDDECFGYVPILGLGGPKKIQNLQKVKLIEHIYIINHFMGPIE